MRVLALAAGLPLYSGAVLARLCGGAPAMSYRRLLRDLSRWRLPPGDEERVRVLLKQVVRAPAGDDVLPAALCASLCKTYSTLQRPGRLGVISILAAFGARDDIVQGAAERLVLSKGRDTAPRLQAHLSLREALVPRHELVANRIVQQAGGLPFLVALRADLLAALSGQLELGEVDGMGGDGGGGGGGSGVGSSDRARARCYLETLRTRARVAVQARLLGMGLGSRASRRRLREIGRRSSRDRSSPRRRARGGGCWTTRSAACSRPGVRPCCCTPAAAPRAHTAPLLLHLTPCTSE